MRPLLQFASGGLLLCLFVLSGCGGTPPDQPAVEGTIQFKDGTKINGWNIVMNQKGSEAPVPIVNGTFYFSNAIPGQASFKLSHPGGTPPPKEWTNPDGGPPPSPEKIPSKYLGYKDSNLGVTVAEKGVTQVKFTLEK